MNIKGTAWRDKSSKGKNSRLCGHQDPTDGQCCSHSNHCFNQFWHLNSSFTFYDIFSKRESNCGKWRQCKASKPSANIADLHEELQTFQSASLRSWLNPSYYIKSYPCAKGGIHTREADACWYKLQSSSLLGNRLCSMLPLFLCQNYLFILLFWSRLGLSISDLARTDTVYSCCYSLSDGVQFLNLHWFPLTPLMTCTFSHVKCF